MKKILFPALLFLTFQSFGQKWKSIRGDGNTTSVTRTVEAFTGISSEGSWNVEITEGTPGTVTLKGDENLLPYIETTVKNGVLSIKSKGEVNLRSNSKITVEVTMNQINSLKLSGSGGINGKGGFTSDGNTDIAVSGSGNLNLDFDTFKDLTVQVSGSGNIRLNGNTRSMHAHVSGSGNIDCRDTRANDLTAMVSGSGNIKVHADKSINAVISGSGDIFYTGNPENIAKVVSGSGRVIKL